jgi:hypothetical protein
VQLSRLQGKQTTVVRPSRSRGAGLRMKRATLRILRTKCRRAVSERIGRVCRETEYRGYSDTAKVIDRVDCPSTMLARDLHCCKVPEFVQGALARVSNSSLPVQFA